METEADEKRRNKTKTKTKSINQIRMKKFTWLSVSNGESKEEYFRSTTLDVFEEASLDWKTHFGVVTVIAGTFMFLSSLLQVS